MRSVGSVKHNENRKNFMRKKWKKGHRHLAVVASVAGLLVVGAVVGAHRSVTSSSGQSPPPLTPSISTGEFLPRRSLTPGAVRTTDKAVVCGMHGTRSIRPPVSYTNALKAQGIANYGYTDMALSSYEEDHLIPLELGGDPRSPLNLWPEPWAGVYGAQVKDQVENASRAAVCGGTIGLVDAQNSMARDWVDLGRRLGVIR